MILPIKILNQRLYDFGLPSRGSPLSAGLDLRACPDDGLTDAVTFLHPGDSRMFKTGFSCAIPEGYYGRIAPRSGLAVEKGIDVMAGVVDADYRDEIGVILINLSKEEVIISDGDRIAQLIIEKIAMPEISVVDELPGANRGGGFGSTGIA